MPTRFPDPSRPAAALSALVRFCREILGGDPAGGYFFTERARGRSRSAFPGPGAAEPPAPAGDPRGRAESPAPAGPAPGGAGPVSPAALLDADGLLGRIRPLLPVSDAEFASFVRPLAEAAAAYMYTLPASEYYHHNDPGGLLRHSLETAFFACRSLGGECLDSGLPGNERTAREGRTAAAVFAAALLHDVGKPLADVRVFAAAGEGGDPGREDGRIFWEPLREGLYEFLKRLGARRYYYEYVPYRGRRHEQLAIVAAGRVIPGAFAAWLMETPDVLENLLGAVCGGKQSPFTRIVKSADMASVRYDLRHARLGGLRAGVCASVPAGPAAIFRENVSRSDRVMTVALELLQKYVAEETRGREDGPVAFVGDSCYLTLTTNDLLAILRPLRNADVGTGIAGVADFYEKLILAGVGEYADPAAGRIVARALTTFDGKRVTEIRGLKIRLPRYVCGGFRPAPLEDLTARLGAAYDRIRAGLPEGAAPNITVAECLGAAAAGAAPGEGERRTAPAGAPLPGEIPGAAADPLPAGDGNAAGARAEGAGGAAPGEPAGPEGFLRFAEHSGNGTRESRAAPRAERSEDGGVLDLGAFLAGGELAPAGDGSAAADCLDWLENPLRLKRSPPRPRDAKGRFVKAAPAPGQTPGAARPGGEAPPRGAELPPAGAAADSGDGSAALWTELAARPAGTLAGAFGSLPGRRLKSLAAAVVKNAAAPGRKTRRGAAGTAARDGDGVPDPRERALRKIAPALRRAARELSGEGAPAGADEELLFDLERIARMGPGKIALALKRLPPGRLTGAAARLAAGARSFKPRAAPGPGRQIKA